MHVSILNLSLVLHICVVRCALQVVAVRNTKKAKKKEKLATKKPGMKKIWSFFSIRKVLLHKFFMILAIIEKFGDSQMKKINEKMKKNDVYFSAMFAARDFENNN